MKTAFFCHHKLKKCFSKPSAGGVVVRWSPWDFVCMLFSLYLIMIGSYFRKPKSQSQNDQVTGSYAAHLIVPLWKRQICSSMGFMWTLAYVIRNEYLKMTFIHACPNPRKILVSIPYFIYSCFDSFSFHLLNE